MSFVGFLFAIAFFFFFFFASSLRSFYSQDGAGIVDLRFGGHARLRWEEPLANAGLRTELDGSDY